MFLVILLIIFASLVRPTSSLSARPEIQLLDLLGSTYQIPIINYVQKTNNHTSETNDRNKFLAYSIFEGRSALRNFPHGSLFSNDDKPSPSLSKASKALLLLCAGYGDAAHEVILGVDVDNMKEAEYAATHPGQTSWNDDHPLEDIDDWIHSILHRIEGNDIGEGGHTGFENAKFWAAGGPKSYDRLETTPWKEALCELAKRKAPISVGLGVVVDDMADKSHSILSGGGKPPRTVTIPRRCWDPIQYIELCRQECEATTHDLSLQEELDWLHRVEIALLFLFEERKENFDVEEIVEICCSKIL